MAVSVLPKVDCEAWRTGIHNEIRSITTATTTRVALAKSLTTSTLQSYICNFIAEKSSHRKDFSHSRPHASTEVWSAQIKYSWSKAS
jgi:hypothetical protein